MMNSFLSLCVFNVWRSVRLSVALSGLLGLTACMVGPDYVRPTIDVGVQFKESPGWKRAQPALASAPREPWWLMYRDPTLTDLMQALNVSNQNIALAEARFRQAVAVTQGARAPLLPTLTATGSATRAGAVASTSASNASVTSNS